MLREQVGCVPSTGGLTSDTQRLKRIGRTRAAPQLGQCDGISAALFRSFITGGDLPFLKFVVLGVRWA